MDRLLREGNPPTGQLASPKPQYKKPGEDAYEPVEGQYGAPFAILKNASGQVISPATDAKLEQVKSELELIKSELQTIKANQLSGDQKVQLSGTITEVVKVVDALAITTSSTRYINLPSLTRYRDWDLFVTNTLDEECRVGFTGEPTSNTIDVVTESGEVVTYNPGTTYNKANYKVNGTMRDVRLSTLPMATKIPDPAEYKKLSTVIKNIAIRAATPPTAGAISITLVGWY